MIDFQNNKISHDEIFDLDLWAKYFAMNDILSTHHGALIKSPKFYYNSLSRKFEPIPNDGHRHHANYWKYNNEFDDKILLDEIDETIAYSFTRSFFYDEDNNIKLNFTKKYLSYLKEYLIKFLKNFLIKILKKLRLNSLICGDYYFYDNVF